MNNGIQALTRQLDHLRDFLTTDVANFASSTGTMVVKQAEDAKDIVVDRGGDLVVALSKAIKKNPLAAVGIAFGVGYLAMRFVPLIGRSTEAAKADSTEASIKA
jgi:ElaB/YqjD/DUF883 family membrane-anchored ribosome-binding protein